MKNKIFLVISIVFILGVSLFFMIMNTKKTYRYSEEGRQIIQETYQKKDSSFFAISDNFENATSFSKIANIYKINSKDEFIKLTDYVASSYDGYQPSLDNVQVIDEKYVGYSRCSVEKENANCEVYRLDLTTKKTESLSIAPQDDFVGSLAFFDANTFVYSVMYDGEDTGGIFLVKNGKETILKKINLLDIFNLRSGEAIEGGIANLVFSPDGTKMSVSIGPGPAGGNGDTFIFDLFGKEIGRISSATQVQWKDSTTIVFSLIDGVYSFDINTGKKTNLLGGTIQNPKISQDLQKIVYWINEGKGEVWLFTIGTKQNEKIAENASHPLWISPEEIIFSYNNKPVYSEESRSEGFSQSIMKYTISSKEVYEVFDMSKKEGNFEFLSPLKDAGSHSFYVFPSLAEENLEKPDLEDIVQKMKNDKAIRSYLQNLCTKEDCIETLFYEWREEKDSQWNDGIVVEDDEDKYYVAFLSVEDDELWKKDPFSYSTMIFRFHRKTGEIFYSSPFIGDFEFVSNIYE